MEKQEQKGLKPPFPPRRNEKFFPTPKLPLSIPFKERICPFKNAGHESKPVTQDNQCFSLPALTNIINKLLQSKIHEERLVALLILVEKFQNCQGDKDGPCQKLIFNFYLKNTKYINNWDLVDLSATKIVGSYFSNKDRKVLYKLARSKSMWERRIAVLATFWFIRKDDFNDALKISEMLLADKHDLIHKAVGWMLREIGKRDQGVEEKFLKKHYKKMPRTMLRYAIERFPEPLRLKYLNGKVNS